MNQLSNEAIKQLADVFESVFDKLEGVLLSHADDREKLFEAYDKVAELEEGAVDADLETAEKLSLLTEKVQTFAEKLLRAMPAEEDQIPTAQEPATESEF
jgi:hypothetical protein